MKTIQLTQGMVATVDDEDYQMLSRYKWCYDRYATTNIRGVDGKQRRVYMHRMIAGTEIGKETDHINGNKVDNRRANLRTCSRAENLRNVGVVKRNKSGFKGVFFLERTKKWLAAIKFDGKKYHLGYFEKKEEAAKAYNEAAKKYHGEFARLNVLA